METLIAFLIPFLILKESGGDWNCKPGDDGKALGGLQIHAAAWQDGCNELGVDWDYQTGAYDPDKAKAVCTAYLLRYGRNYKRKTGKDPSVEVLARIWNGGPTGWKKKATESYWTDVEAIISERSPGRFDT